MENMTNKQNHFINNSIDIVFQLEENNIVDTF